MSWPTIPSSLAQVLMVTATSHPEKAPGRLTCDQGHLPRAHALSCTSFGGALSPSVRLEHLPAHLSSWAGRADHLLNHFLFSAHPGPVSHLLAFAPLCPWGLPPPLSGGHHITLRLSSWKPPTDWLGPPPGTHCASPLTGLGQGCALSWVRDVPAVSVVPACRSGPSSSRVQRAFVE